MLFRSARGVAASVAAVFAVDLLAFAAVAGPTGLVAASVTSVAASVAVTGALLLTLPGTSAGATGSVLFVGPVGRQVAPSLGSRLTGLLPAGALGGRSLVYRRAHARNLVDTTATMKDPARPPASSADRAPAQARVHELP